MSKTKLDLSLVIKIICVVSVQVGRDGEYVTDHYE